MSRNKDRTGMGDSRPDVGSPPPAVLQQENPAFSFVVPTEFVELPSQGKYYPKEHPLHDQESIEIKQLTAKEEDMLTSRTLLKKGVALERVLKSLIVDKTIDPDTMFIGDRNAIIIAARVSGYGNEYTTKVTCPKCNTTQDYDFDLNNAKVYYGEDAAALDVTDHGDGTYDVMLPRLQMPVTFRLLNGRDERSLITPDKKKQEVISNHLITSQLRNIVVGVQGDTSATVVNMLIENIPSMDSRHLRLAYRLSAPNIDLTHSFECVECNFEQDMEVPLTADFFWPDQ